MDILKWQEKYSREEIYLRKMNYKRGRNLKLVREYRGYSQSKLCKELKGVSQSNLSRFEKGFPSLSEKSIKRIMQHLNWPYDFLESFDSHNIQLSWDL